MHRVRIKNTARFLYQWFPTLPINKGILEAKGVLAKTCHVSVKIVRYSTTHKTNLLKIGRQLFWHIRPTSDLFQMDAMPTRYICLFQVWVWAFRHREFYIGKFNKSSHWIHNKVRTHAKHNTINKASLAEVLLGLEIKVIERQTCQQSEFLMPQTCMHWNKYVFQMKLANKLAFWILAGWL